MADSDKTKMPVWETTDRHFWIVWQSAPSVYLAKEKPQINSAYCNDDLTGKERRILFMANHRKSTFAFCIILIFQLCVLTYFCCQKKSFHIDEVYTYILSNSYHTDRISNSDKVFDRWINGEETFHDFVTVQSGEQFAYHKVYYNNSRDAHPPLYYFLVHTVSSLFPDLYSKWIGLGINLFFFVLTQIVLFRLSVNILGDRKWALLPPLIYGTFPICIDTVLFIRMYAMLTFFTILTFFIHWLFYAEKLKLPFLWIFLITFAGTFTHYYFAVPSFYLAAAFCLFLLVKKQIKKLIGYSFSMLSGVGCVFLLYPAALSQITGSSTNNVGKEVAKSILNVSVLAAHIKEYLDELWRLSRIRVSLAVLAFFIIFVTALFFCLRRRKKKVGANIFILGEMLAVFAFTCLVMLYFNGFFAQFSKRSNSLAKMLILISAVVIPASIAAYLLYKKKKTGAVLTLAPDDKKRLITAIVLSFISLSSFVTVVHLSSKFIYLRYIYHLIPICILLSVMIIYILVTVLKLSPKMALSAIVIFSLIYTSDVVLKKKTTQLYTAKYKQEASFADSYQDSPVIVINNGFTFMLTGNFNRLVKCKELYITNRYLQDFDPILKESTSDNDFVFIVLTDNDWSKGYDGEAVMDSIVRSSDILTSYKKAGSASFSTVYVAERSTDHGGN